MPRLVLKRIYPDPTYYIQIELIATIPNKYVIIIYDWLLGEITLGEYSTFAEAEDGLASDLRRYLSH